MGYSTTLLGSLTFNRPLTMAEAKKVGQLNEGDFKSFPHNRGYLDWVVNEDGTALAHNGAEKSYDYVEALRWARLRSRMIEPKGT